MLAMLEWASADVLRALYAPLGQQAKIMQLVAENSATPAAARGGPFMV